MTTRLERTVESSSFIVLDQLDQSAAAQPNRWTVPIEAIMNSERGYPRKLRHISRELGLWITVRDRLFQEKMAQFPSLTLEELEAHLSYATEENFYQKMWAEACSRWPTLTVKERLNLIADGILVDRIAGFDDRSVAQHLKVFLPQLKIYHHGIHIGGRRIIHFTGSIVTSLLGLAEAEVREECLEVFGKTESIEEVKHTDALAPHIIIERAKSQIGRRDYHLFNRNCEHFARWAITGIATSGQIDTIFGKQNRRLNL